MTLSINNKIIKPTKGAANRGLQTKEYKIEFNERQDMSTMNINDIIEFETNSGRAISWVILKIYKNIVTIRGAE